MTKRPFLAASQFSVLIAGFLALLIFPGCGSGAYRERMQAHLKALQEAEAKGPAVKPEMLYQYIPESQLPGERQFNLRVPRIFTPGNLVFHEQTTSRQDNKDFPPAKMWPLGVPVPGYYWTYEGLSQEGATSPGNGDPNKADPGSKSWSFYFTFGAEALSEDEASEEIHSYLEKLNAALARATNANPTRIDESDFKTVAIPSLVGDETVSWKYLRLEADQFFAGYKGRQETSWEKKPGVVEIYSTYHKDHLVVLAGSWIKGTEDATLMPSFLPAVAASVTITGETPLPQE